MIPLGPALELLYTGGRFDASTAYRLGLVDHVVSNDQLLEKARQIAGEIVRSAPLVVQKIKSTVMQGLDMSLSEGVKLEKESSDFLMQTEDAKEACARSQKNAPRTGKRDTES